MQVDATSSSLLYRENVGSGIPIRLQRVSHHILLRIVPRFSGYDRLKYDEPTA